jgi:hypothetical protein
MVPPWNQGGTHDLISCFDCHVTSVGHGGTFEAMGRTDLSTAAGQRDLCVHCHAQAVYQGSGEGSADGSRFADHYRGVHQLAPSGGGRNPQGCRACHAGLANNSGLTANGSPGNIHGGNYTWGEGPSAGSIVQHFMYGGYLSGWSPGTCWAGSCHGGESY